MTIISAYRDNINIKIKVIAATGSLSSDQNRGIKKYTLNQRQWKDFLKNSHIKLARHDVHIIFVYLKMFN